MTLEEARIKFMNLQRKISAFKHAEAILSWDAEIVAPPGTARNTAHSIEMINQELFALKAGEETEELLLFLREHGELLTVRERRSVDFMLRDVDRKKQIPADEYANYERIMAEAQDAWYSAVEENDFGVLRDKLGKMFDILKTFAKYCSPDIDPYEYCIGEFEEGLTVETCDSVFDAVKTHIIPLFEKIKECPPIDDSPLKGSFSKEAQENLTFYIMDLLGLDMTRVGVATSEQPFTMFLGSHFDERVATQYSPTDYTASLYTILNHCGHVLYDMGQEDNLAYTVLDGVASKSLLEAEGRFYENIIGKSKAFIDYIYPDLADLFPDPVARYTPEDVYRAVNKVEDGLIRKDADEVTYNIHVLIRYELEKALLHNELDIRDLPDAWRQKYKEYLGVDVPDDERGVLQDIHWPLGYIGYFPSYVLGNFYSAQIFDKMQGEVNIYECVGEGDFALINMWNKMRIWKHGGLYDAKHVMERIVKAPFSIEPYINYLTKKYTEIYKLYQACAASKRPSMQQTSIFRHMQIKEGITVWSLKKPEGNLKDYKTGCLQLTMRSL